MLFPELFSCSDCSVQFVDINSLCKHLKYSHLGSSQKFYCPYQGCVAQAYVTRSSFTNHIRKQHAELKRKIRPVCTSDSKRSRTSHTNTEMLQSIDISVRPVNCIQNNDNPLLVQEGVLPETTENIPQKYDMLLNDFKESALKLALNLYSNPKLPMNQLFQIFRI